MAATKAEIRAMEKDLERAKREWAETHQPCDITTCGWFKHGAKNGCGFYNFQDDCEDFRKKYGELD